MPTNLTRLRASARAARVPASDTAALQLATRLAQLLDDYATKGEDEVQVYKLLGPLYLRTLTSMGLTRDGRGVGDTEGSAGGASHDVARRDQLRERRERRAGAGA